MVWGHTPQTEAVERGTWRRRVNQKSFTRVVHMHGEIMFVRRMTDSKAAGKRSCHARPRHFACFA